MIKPQLGDYGLTQEHVSRYELQISNLKNASEKQFESETRDGTVLLAIVGIAFVVLTILAASVGEGSAWVFIFFAVALFVVFIGIVVARSNPQRKANIENSLKHLYVDRDLEARYESYKKALKEYADYKKRISIAYWSQMTGLEFEEAVADLFRRMGYVATVTPSTGDGGVDIILKKGKQRIAVQCKHHKNPIGPNDVRALMGVVLTHGFDSGIFVSFSGYSPTVQDEVYHASGSVDMKLLDLQGLLFLEYRLNEIEIEEKTQKNKQQQETVQKEEKKQENNDSIKKLIGRRVRNETYGEGKIVRVNLHNGNYYVIAEFDGKGEKEFSYTNAFCKGCLSLVEDPVLSKQPNKNGGNMRVVSSVGNGEQKPKKDKTMLLEEGKNYGTRAIDIYDTCCVRLGWKTSKRESFMSQRLLWSKDATPEGYSVWFLAHNNFMGTSNGKWVNCVLFDGDEIAEFWEKKNEQYYDQGEQRVTFVKKPTGYYFYGVYEFYGYGDRYVEEGSKKVLRNVKVYKRVSRTYKSSVTVLSNVAPMINKGSVSVFSKVNPTSPSTSPRKSNPSAVDKYRGKYVRGTYVKQSGYGYGKVTKTIKQSNGDMLLTVRFYDGGKKKLFSCEQDLNNILPIVTEEEYRKAVEDRERSNLEANQEQEKIVDQQQKKQEVEKAKCYYYRNKKAKDFVGLTVLNDKYGTGEVKGWHKDSGGREYVTVKFVSVSREFLYPSAFIEEKLVQDPCPYKVEQK